MDRKFANRIIKDICNKLDLKKSNRIAYRLVEANGFYAMVAFTFEGSGFCKGCFYCRKWVQTFVRPQFGDPASIIFNNGDRIGSLWSEEEFLLEEANVIKEFRKYLSTNSSLEKIFHQLKYKTTDIHKMQDKLYLSIVLGRYSDTKILAKRVIDAIKAENATQEWMLYYRSNAQRVLYCLKKREYQELNDWLKSVQFKAMKDLKIPIPKEGVESEATDLSHSAKEPPSFRQSVIQNCLLKLFGGRDK